MVPKAVSIASMILAKSTPVALDEQNQDGAVAEHLDLLAGVVWMVCEASHRPDWPALLRQVAGIVNSDALVTISLLLFHSLLVSWRPPNTEGAHRFPSKFPAETWRGVIVALEPSPDASGAARTTRTAAQAGPSCWSRGTLRRKSPDRTLLSTAKAVLLHGADHDPSFPIGEASRFTEAHQ